MADERRYDDREVGLILKRVAELHEAGDGADARAMTRQEIEQVVGELGIERSLVSQAVSEVSVQDVRNRPLWWLGGKTDIMFEEVIEGRVDEATLTAMLEVLRRHLGDPGELKAEGGAQIWSTAHSSRRIYFTVVEQGTPRSGADGERRTTLRLEERMPIDARTTVGGVSAAGGVAGFMAMVPLKALVVKAVLLLAMGPLVVSGALAGWVGGRWLWRRRGAAREQQLRRIFAEILALAAPRPPALPDPDA